MACLHKFHDDLNLNYVDWEVRTLFIGTFNPGWPECANNTAEWFYGRTSRNAFWCILPKCHNHPSLLNGNRGVWIDFCSQYGLAITDIITELNTANPNNLVHQNRICSFKDEYLNQFQPVLTNIPRLLEKHPTINRIFITRKVMTNDMQTWLIPTMNWIQANPQRDIRLINLRSPSRGARRGIVGDFCETVKNIWIGQGY